MTDVEKRRKAKELMELYELIENKEQILNSILNLLNVSETPDFYGDMYDWVYRQFGLLKDEELEDIQDAFNNKDLKKIAGYYKE